MNEAARDMIDGARPAIPRRKQRAAGNMLVWLLFASVLALIARLTLFLRQRAPGEYAVVDAAAATEIAIVGVTAALLALMGGRVLTAWRLTAHRGARLWVLYFAFGACMAVQAINPLYSFFRAAEGLIEVLAVAVIIAAMPGFRQAERAALSLAWGALLLDAAGRVKLTGAAAGMFSSNSYSAVAAILATYCLGEALEARGRRRVMLLASGAGAAGLLMLGMSLASWWSALAGLGLAGLVLRPSPFVVVAVLLVGLAALGWGQHLWERVVLRDRPMTEIGTLHGRMVLWEYYWAAFCERPWLGYGFAIGARLKGIAYTTHTHNAIMSALLGVGIPGALLLAGVFVRFAREVVRSRRWGRPGWVGCTAAIACSLVNSMAFSLIGEIWMPATLAFTAFLMLHTVHVLRPPAR